VWADGDDWTPDFTTIQDFAQLLGEDGCRLINEAVVKQAVALGLADTKVAVADMTLRSGDSISQRDGMSGFRQSIERRTQAGQSFRIFGIGARASCGRQEQCAVRLFAKSKTKAAKDRMVGR